MGVETVGGLDPAGIDNDPIRHLETIFALAETHGRGIDIHLHDPGELGLWQIERIADFTQASGLAGKVMISHAFAHGMVPTAQIEKLGRRLADLRISLMTTAPADYSLPPVAFLKALGVNICCGSDGIRDAWSPFGNGDMLERALLLAQRFDWRKDDELASAFDSATTAGARALGLAGYGLAPGHAANFILLPAENLSDAIARRPHQRTVVSRGGSSRAMAAFLSRARRSKRDLCFQIRVAVIKSASPAMAPVAVTTNGLMSASARTSPSDALMSEKSARGARRLSFAGLPH